MRDRFEASHRGRGLQRALVFLGGLAFATLLAMSVAAFVADYFARAATAMAVSMEG